MCDNTSLNIIIKDYEPLSKPIRETLLGCGSFGYVYRNNDQAIKISRDTIVKCDSYLFNLIREISLMITLQKYGVTPIVYKISLGKRISFNMELFDFSLEYAILNENLKSNIQRHSKRIIFNIICSLACAQIYGILHRDVKPANVLLNINFKAKLTDWGLASTQIGTFSGLQDQSVQTIWYRCPEHLLDIKEYYNNFTIDMWSIGIIMIEMLTGKVGFIPGKNKIECLHYILNKFGIPERSEDSLLSFKLDNLFEEKLFNKTNYKGSNKITINKIIKNTNDIECSNFIKSCLELSPIKRLNAVSALYHPFFSDLYENLSEEIKELLNKNTIIQKIELQKSVFPIDSKKINKSNQNYLKHTRNLYLSILTNLNYESKDIELFSCCVAYLDKLHEIIDFNDSNVNLDLFVSVYFIVFGIAYDTPCKFLVLKKMFGYQLIEQDILYYTNTIIKMLKFPIAIQTVCTFRECFNDLHGSLTYVFDMLCLFVIQNNYWFDFTSEEIFFEIVNKMNSFVYIKNKKIILFNNKLVHINNYVKKNNNYNHSVSCIDFNDVKFDMNYQNGKIMYVADIVNQKNYCCFF